MKQRKKKLLIASTLSLVPLSFMVSSCASAPDTPKKLDKTPPTPTATQVKTKPILPKAQPTKPTLPKIQPTKPKVISTPTTAKHAVNSQEKALAKLIQSYSKQQRSKLVYNPILATVARQRAKDMATRKYFSHTTPDGIGPNYFVEKAGYKLPNFYNKKKNGNNIESIAAGNDTAQKTFDQWLKSPGHRRHMLGETGFYREQTDFGIGYYASPSSPYRHYWVLLSGKH